MDLYLETQIEENSFTCATTTNIISNINSTNTDTNNNGAVCDNKTVNDDQYNEYKTHPLLVTLILQVLLDLLPLEDLKNARVVCSYWNQVATSLMKKKAPAINFDADNYWTDETNHRIKIMKNLTEIVASSINFPVVKFDVGISLLTVRHKPTLNSFFIVCSPLIEELTIRDTLHGHIVPFWYPKILMLPRLHSLRLHLMDSQSNARYFFRFVQYIIQLSPALKELILIDYNEIEQIDVVNQMIFILRRNPVKHLKSLLLQTKINSDHLNSLSRLNLGLQSLSLNFRESIITPDFVSEFLSSLRTTLMHLELDYNLSGPVCPIEFPCMKRLNKLEIKGSIFGNSSLVFPTMTIDYTQQFPNLRKLCLGDGYFAWSQFLAPSTPTLTVQELELPSFFVGHYRIRSAAIIFPNLKKLDVWDSAKILETVFEEMVALEELVIHTRYGIGNIDCRITGFPSAVCQRFLLNNCSETMDQVKHLRVTKPITNLTKLKKLQIKCNYSIGDMVQITDVVCHYAFLYLPQLQVLDLSDFPPNWFSEMCLAEMSKAFCVIL